MTRPYRSLRTAFTALNMSTAFKWSAAFRMGTALVVSLSCSGCSGFNPATGTGDSADETGAEPVDADCDDWKEAYCAWMDECGSLRLDECSARVKDVQCKESAPLDRCVDELTSGDCAPPQGCDAEDVADTAKARAECVAFQQAYCEYLLSCQPSIYVSLGACVSAFDEQLPCADAYATAEGYDDCISTLESPGCNGYPPTQCENVIFTQ